MNGTKPRQCSQCSRDLSHGPLCSLVGHLTTREQVAATAEANGWALHRDDGNLGMRMEYRKGRRHLYVEFSVRGTVTYASTSKNRIDGPGKATRVLGYLAS